jgi:hypothetical protein
MKSLYVVGACPSTDHSLRWAQNLENVLYSLIMEISHTLPNTQVTQQKK